MLVSQSCGADWEAFVVDKMKLKLVERKVFWFMIAGLIAIITTIIYRADNYGVSLGETLIVDIIIWILMIHLFNALHHDADKERK